MEGTLWIATESPHIGIGYPVGTVYWSPNDDDIYVRLSPFETLDRNALNTRYTLGARRGVVPLTPDLIRQYVEENDLPTQETDSLTDRRPGILLNITREVDTREFQPWDPLLVKDDSGTVADWSSLEPGRGWAFARNYLLIGHEVLPRLAAYATQWHGGPEPEPEAMGDGWLQVVVTEWEPDPTVPPEVTDVATGGNRYRVTRRRLRAAGGTPRRYLPEEVVVNIIRAAADRQGKNPEALFHPNSGWASLDRIEHEGETYLRPYGDEWLALHHYARFTIGWCETHVDATQDRIRQWEARRTRTEVTLTIEADGPIDPERVKAVAAEALRDNASAMRVRVL